jgi:internalin A
MTENELMQVIERAAKEDLQSLDLRSKQLSILPPEIGKLTSLQSLDLGNNQLSSLPPEIVKLEQLKTIDLRGNPIPIPPEILGPKQSWEQPGDIDAILDFYFRAVNPEDTEPLYEAKLLLVGEGGAGKTSLANKVQDEHYQLNPNEASTEGINVIRWDFEQPNHQSFRVNIWDFGGQEIYHSTHQFFLTRRSVYALVADTRKENTDFYYWLKVIELLSDKSPVLIVKNEKDNRPCEINERHLRGEFGNLKDILATNLATNRGLGDIKQAVQQQVTRLPHLGTPLPKIWVRMRAALENYTSTRNYLGIDEYFSLCRANQITDHTDMVRLSGYLHDLGVCLHFQDDPLLKHTMILRPEWATTAVYKVLDTQKVRKDLGRFTGDDLKDIWADEYAEKRDELLQLMMRFRLCYEIPGRLGTYIAPHLLSANQPGYEWDDKENLHLRYEYDFMPKGILTRFIVEMHRKDSVAVWYDTKIKAGAKWKDEIEDALGTAKVAVLLVSPHFLGSDFIAENELPPLLEAARKHGLVILWVYLTSCLYEETEIKDYQAAHDISKPLDHLTLSEQNAVLVDVCRKIKAAANPQ